MVERDVKWSKVRVREERNRESGRKRPSVPMDSLPLRSCVSLARTFPFSKNVYSHVFVLKIKAVSVAISYKNTSKFFIANFVSVPNVNCKKSVLKKVLFTKHN